MVTWRREAWRQRALAATGIVLLLALGSCGQADTPATAGLGEHGAGGAPIGQFTPVATPRSAPTVDLVAKNLTATAYRPTVALVTPGLVRPGTPSHGGPIIDHVSFIDQLRGKRCIVDFLTPAQPQPFLRGEAIDLLVSGCTLAQPAELQSFWYHTDDLHTDGLRAAEDDAHGIGADGQPTGMAIAWAASPHFFRKERAFALYLGDDPALLALLTELLGPQFAGR